MKHRTRFYRNYSGAPDQTFNVKIDTSDLYIRADVNLYDEAFSALKSAREELECYIQKHDSFLHSLDPLTPNGDEDEMTLAMYKASSAAGVGPMAAVAGAIAEKVGRELLKYCDEIIIENGGDLWIMAVKPVVIGLYINNIYFTNNIGIRITPEKTPCSVCTSTSRLGHSLSFGKADSVTVIADSGAISDAAATAVCNMVKTESDIEKALDFGMSISGVTGCIIVYRDRLGVQGNVELCRL